MPSKRLSLSRPIVALLAVLFAAAALFGGLSAPVPSPGGAGHTHLIAHADGHHDHGVAELAADGHSAAVDQNPDADGSGDGDVAVDHTHLAASGVPGPLSVIWATPVATVGDAVRVPQDPWAGSRTTAPPDRPPSTSTLHA